MKPQLITAETWKRTVTYLIEMEGAQGAFDIAIGTKLGSGRLWPTLQKLEALGIIVAAWQDGVDGRPKKRVFTVAAGAKAKLQELLK